MQGSMCFATLDKKSNLVILFLTLQFHFSPHISFRATVSFPHKFISFFDINFLKSLSSIIFFISANNSFHLSLFFETMLLSCVFFLHFRSTISSFFKITLQNLHTHHSSRNLATPSFPPLLFFISINNSFQKRKEKEPRIFFFERTQ